MQGATVYVIIKKRKEIWCFRACRYWICGFCGNDAVYCSR